MRLHEEMVGRGWNRSLSEFCDRIMDVYNEAYPDRDILTLMFDPSEAMRFCDVVRFRVQCTAFPDTLILRALWCRRQERWGLI